MDESTPTHRLELHPRAMTSALIEIRLSNETEESNLPERQLDQDTRCCQLRGWDIAHVAGDLDVSGAISPFDRQDLGREPPRCPELIDQWDVLVVARLDRSGPPSLPPQLA